MNQSMRFGFQFGLVFLIILFVFVSCENESNQKQDAPRKYKCYFANCRLAIDGDLDERAWQQAEWSQSFIDIEGTQQPSPRHKTQMKMLWDTKFLYIAAYLEEPHLWATLSNRDDIIYRDNDFEVFIDPNGDGLNYYEFEINALGTEFDLLMNKPYNKKGSANIPWDFSGLVSAVQTYGTLNNPKDTDSCWTLEMAIPWEAFSEDEGKKPLDGEVWRMNFSRVQWQLEIKNNTYVKMQAEDGKPLPENNWVWSPQGAVNMHMPEKWGFVEFVEKSPKEEETFAETPKFWVWISAHQKQTESYWDSTFSQMKDIGIGGVLMNANPEILTEAIRVADKYGIQIHAWFWTMNRGDADPSWLSVNRLGNSLATQKAYVDYYKFMCPALPEVRCFLQTKIDELADVKGLKGIHMDYIRYVDAILPIGLQPNYGLVQDHVFAEFDYGYHPYLRQLYQNKSGIDPLQFPDIENNKDWLDFRLAVLDTTVWGIRNQVRCEGLTISSAVFPSPEMSKKMVRQGWDKWRLDYYFPMIYHNFYNESIAWIEKIVAEDVAAVGEGSKVFCGLYVPALREADDLTKAMKAAMHGGADGIAFFDWRAIGEEQQQQIKIFFEEYRKKN